MGRRRSGPEGAFTFDLVPDDGSEVGDSPAAGPGPSVRGGAVEQALAVEQTPETAPPPGPVSRARRRWRGLSHRTRLGALVVAVALVGTFVVVDGVTDRARSMQLRAAAGGVVDLSAPPVEAWQLDGAELGERMLGGLVAVAGDVAAVHRDGELVGIDLATGQERWGVELAEPRVQCGPGLAFWGETVELASTSRIACVGPTPSGEVMVTSVDADGTMLGRRAVPGEHDLVVPGPSGSVLTFAWVGDPADVDVELRGDPMTDLQVIGEIDAGYDLEVRLTDAVSGEEAWTETVEFGDVVDPRQCVRWSTGGHTAEVDRRSEIEPLVSETLVGVSGCGILAYFTPAGERLDVTVPGGGGGDDATTLRVLPLVDGGYAASTGMWGRSSESFAVLGPDGAHRYTVEGRLLEPQATDGRSVDRRLVAADGQTRAVDPAGAELWVADIAAAGFLARAGSVAVVRDEQDRVIGLDLDTGEVLWTRPGILADDTALAEEWRRGPVRSVFTDGGVVAVVVPSYTDARVVTRWQAIDASTGEDLWSTDVPEDHWGVDVAVDGHLLRWWPDGIMGFTT